MSEILSFPAKGARSGEVVITINGYWNGPLYYFEVMSTAMPPDDPRIVTTNNFDVALRAALKHAGAFGLEGVRFTLTAEEMNGGVA